MKRIFTIVAAVMMAVPLIQAQESVESMFNKGDNVINLGIGIGNTLYTGSYYTKGVPPVSFSFEHGIVDGVLDKGVIGILGYVGYSSYKYDYLGWGYKYSNIIIGAGGLFHYPLVKKLDTYAGILLGYNIATAKEFGTSIGWDYNATSGGIIFSGFVGARYYFTESIAAFAQLGYGIAYLTFGVSIRL
ncbi:MAG: hypothetical protein E4H10_10655 [Bacteroidia bacterium]|nr:MAG: hypothetical protein E4H10_10655 [Bacteroidia bacterium]